MLYLKTSGSEVNKVAFYTSDKIDGIDVGDEIYLVFTQDYSLTSSSLDSTINKLANNYIVFDISGSDLPQAGGLYSVALNTEVCWNNYDELWDTANGLWNLPIIENTIDTERAFLFELIPDNEYLSPNEEANYITASLDIEEEEEYISVREQSSYYVYNG